MFQDSEQLSEGRKSHWQWLRSRFRYAATQRPHAASWLSKALSEKYTIWGKSLLSS